MRQHRQRPWADSSSFLLLCPSSVMRDSGLVWTLCPQDRKSSGCVAWSLCGKACLSSQNFTLNYREFFNLALTFFSRCSPLHRLVLMLCALKCVFQVVCWLGEPVLLAKRVQHSGRRHWAGSKANSEVK